MDTDITSLISSDEFYSIIASSIDGFLFVSLSGRILETNNSFCQISGYSRSEILAMPHISEIDSIITAEEMCERLDKIKRCGSLRFVTRLLCKDGTIKIVEISANYTDLYDGAFYSFVRDITQQKEAEELYRNIVDTQTEFVDRYLPGGVLTYINPSLERFTGIKAEELLGKSFYQFLHEDDREETISRIESISINNPVVETESRIILPDGNIRWNRWTSTGFFNDQGVVISYQSVGRDITERKLAENALLESEQRNRLLTETMLHGLVYQDANGTIISMNPAAERILGKNREDFLGSNSVEEEHDTIRENGELFPGIEHPAMVSLNTGLPVSAVVMGVYNPKLAEYRWISVNAVPVFYSDKTSPSEVYTLFEDITERKRAEENLAKSEHHFRSLFEEMTEGVALHKLTRDCSGSIDNYRIEKINSAYTEILGISPEDVTGKLATEAYSTDTPVYLKEYSEVVQSRKPIRFNTYFAQLDKHFDISVIPWESDGFATIFMDVTARIKAEENQRLQAEQLLQAQKLESLGVLAGGIAHDFNNILAIIVGHCSLALMEPETANTHIPDIEKAAERAAGLCRQMLAYAGKELFAPQEINIGTLVEEMILMLKASINQNVVINLNLPTGLPLVKADTNQIRQVAMNLILNASEAIGDTQGEVRVSLTKTSVKPEQQENDHLGNIIPPGCYICLEVIDNGCGMSNETKRRIFEPFYTTKFTGRGLGMSAILGIINTHKGALQLFSEPGKGTTFKVYLPIKASGCCAEYAQQQAIQAEAWQGSGTVLLVEDEVAIMPIARAMLNKLGFKTVEAYNGKEALELYQKYATEIWLVVTDLGMPVMDGYALIAELKKLDPDLPVIISSGFGESIVKDRLYNKGISEMIINKPYNFDQMRDVLKRAVAAKSDSC